MGQTTALSGAWQEVHKVDGIQISHLTRDYGGGRGIFDLSLEIPTGEAFGLLGPNGAGKTTTIRHLMGFLPARSGSCRIGGLDCWRDAAQVQEMVGYIAGEPAFFDQMDGMEYLQFLQKYRRMPGPGRRQELLERFEVNPRGKLRKMSKGMRQKIAIVAAFQHDPAILILDEPTSGLDPLMQNRFIALLQEEKQRGKTILLSSHMFEEVERTCDRVGMVRAGHMVALDSTDALRQRHVRSYTVALPTPEAAAAFAADFGGQVDPVQAAVVHVSARPTLEEIFLHCYGQEESR